MESPVLVEVTRGPEVESRHRGQIAVVDAAGRLRYQVGNPEIRVCLRSLAKPFQTLPVLTTGTAAAFGFGSEELALFSGSLSGQDFQVELVQKVLGRLGLDVSALMCGSHPPLHRPTAAALTQEGKKPTALHHTCAGKHTAMLAVCVHQGWPVAGYLELDHPVQQLIWRTVAEFGGLPVAEVPVALDGCSAPVFYLPLWRIAWAFARLAAAPANTPENTIMAACLAHPRLIAGDDRLETILMQALPNRLFAKTGAEGGFALALPEKGLGVALKIEDGAARALAPAIIEVLEQMGMLTAEVRDNLANLRQPAIYNHQKQTVGRVTPVFRLGEV